MSQQITGTSPDELDRRLVQIWSVHLPVWIDPWAVRLADAFADGAWTARWRKVSAFAPPIAFGVGFLFPVLWPWMKDVYTESLLFMMIVVAGAILSGPVGVMLLLGYVLGDLASVLFERGYGRGPRLAGHFVSYMLLALPAVILPQLGHECPSRSPRSGRPSRSFATRCALCFTPSPRGYWRFSGVRP